MEDQAFQSRPHYARHFGIIYIPLLRWLMLYTLEYMPRAERRQRIGFTILTIYSMPLVISASAGEQLFDYFK